MHISRLRTCSSQGRVLISLLWIAGLILGCCLALFQSETTLLFIRQISRQRMSVVVLTISLLCPFVISYFAFRLRLWFVIYLIVFIKATCFSFCALCLEIAFGDAGWLVYRLYLFSDSCCVIILMWFWNHCIAIDSEKLNRSFYFCFAMIAAVCFMDFIIVSPFVIKLFD